MSEIICVFGMRGSGKTYHTKELIKKIDRLVVYDTLSEYRDICSYNIFDFETLKRHMFGDKFRLAFEPRRLTTSFEPTCLLIGSIGANTFVIEEVDYYSSTFYIPDGLSYIVRYGRHRDVSLILTARRPAEVPRLITSQANRIHIFRVIEPRDIFYLSEFIGEEARKLKSLTRGQYIAYEEGEVISHYDT